MSTEPIAMNTPICARCATVCDGDDNFCRHCGLALGEARLPSVPAPSLPTVWQPRLRGVAIRGAAFIVAGTVAELVARRMVRRAIGTITGRPAARGSKRPAHVISANGNAEDDAQLESETLLLRRIRIRR